MKLAYFEATSEDKGFALPGVEILSLPNHIDEQHLPPDPITIDLISIFIGSRISVAVLDALPNLKLITTRSTGYDYIDEQHLPPDPITIDLISIFIGSRISVAVLDALPNLKLITTRSTGYDHIDVAT